jgi:hypothetical protein
MAPPPGRWNVSAYAAPVTNQLCPRFCCALVASAQVALLRRRDLSHKGHWARRPAVARVMLAGLAPALDKLWTTKKGLCPHLVRIVPEICRPVPDTVDRNRTAIWLRLTGDAI